MLIVINPDDLRRTASRMEEAGREYAVHRSRLAGVEVWFMPSDVRANVVSTTGRVAAELARLESELIFDAQNLRDRASLAFGESWESAMAVGAPGGRLSNALLHGYAQFGAEIGFGRKGWSFPKKLPKSLNAWLPRWGNQYGRGRKLITDAKVADGVRRRTTSPAALTKAVRTGVLDIVFGLWGVYAGIQDARQDLPYKSTPGKIDRADIELTSDIVSTVSGGALVVSGVLFLASPLFPPLLPIAGLLWTASLFGGLGSTATDVALEHWDAIKDFGRSKWNAARNGWKRTEKAFSRLGDRIGL